MTKTRKVLQMLRDYESRNVTHIEPDGSWPIVWERARGVHVWDAEGKKYLDLTAAFGVAAAGHANSKIIQAGRRQMGTLLHAMGDVHPHALKAQLARELSRLTFERWEKKRAKTIFCNSGFESIEAALKTALLATGKHGVIGFEGAYHGLGYGTLNVTHRNHFRSPFRTQLREFTHFVPFPIKEEQLAGIEKQIRRIARKEKIGSILVEPIQARGGINIPPAAFLPLLRRIADDLGAVLVFDEVYTGFGRTGKWFACEHSATVPDLVCVGKALTGGFPLSACIGRADLMDKAWPPSTGEAIHTSTFLGHPVGCAMALANLREIERLRLPQHSGTTGKTLLRELSAFEEFSGFSIRGVGLMAALELRDEHGRPDTVRSLEAMKQMLRHGYIVLPEGEHANVLGFTPPLIISERDLVRAVSTLKQILLPRK